MCKKHYSSEKGIIIIVFLCLQVIIIDIILKSTVHKSLLNSNYTVIIDGLIIVLIYVESFGDI